MRGSRVKSLRRRFKEEYGRSPTPAEWTLREDEKAWEVKRSEVRGLKKLYRKIRQETNTKGVN